MFCTVTHPSDTDENKLLEKEQTKHLFHYHPFRITKKASKISEIPSIYTMSPKLKIAEEMGDMDCLQGG